MQMIRVSHAKLACRLGVTACILLLTSCASTKVVKRQRLVKEQLPRPSKIIVYNFVADPAKVPHSSVLTGRTAQNVKVVNRNQLILGRKLGVLIANELVKEINKLGVPAVKDQRGMQLQVNDIVLRGYLLSVIQGDATKRVVVGFGYGSAQLTTFVEGYQVTAHGLRKLGSAQLNAGGNKTPGGALGALTFLANANPIGLIVGLGAKSYGEISGSSKVSGMAKNTAEKIADVLKKRFKEERWIK